MKKLLEVFNELEQKKKELKDLILNEETKKENDIIKNISNNLYKVFEKGKETKPEEGLTKYQISRRIESCIDSKINEIRSLIYDIRSITYGYADVKVDVEKTVELISTCMVDLMVSVGKLCHECKNNAK
jgi:hypothetical protein